MKKNFFLIFLILFSTASWAEDLNYKKSPLPSKTFSFFFENDTFFDTDKEYTNGIRLSMTYANLPPRYLSVQNLLENIGKLTQFSEKSKKQAFSLSMGQNIYTPENTEATEIVKTERPYAGLTYISAGIISTTSTQMQTIELSAGIVGPLSLAEKTQTTLHNAFNWKEVMGWDNQLSNEPFLGLVYSKRWKIKQKSNQGFGFDIIPEMSATFGNAFIYLQSGIGLRVGYNIPNDFGTPRIRPATDTNFPLDEADPRFYPKFERFGIYFFCNMDAKFVPRNILLDGNTFKSSHSVKRYPATGTTILGLGIIVHRFNIVYGHVFDSKLYKDQKDKQRYGTISISYSW